MFDSNAAELVVKSNMRLSVWVYFTDVFDFFRFFSYFKAPADGVADNTNISVMTRGDYLYAMTETNFLRRLDPETLETSGDKVIVTIKRHLFG